MTTSASADLPIHFRRPWWHVVPMALAVPISFVILTWGNAQIDLTWLGRPLVSVAAGMIVVTAVLAAVLRDPDRVIVATAAVSLALVVDHLAVAAMLLLLCLLVVVEGFVDRGRPWHFARPITRAWAAFCVGLILVTTLNLVSNGSLWGAFEALQRDAARPEVEEHWAADAPDIWLILLDGYPGAAAGASVAPGWEREAFPAALTARGFDVVRGARTNYLLTRLILPAMFANEHIAEVLPPDAGGNLATRSRKLREVLEGGIVLNELASAGYERVAISSGWAEVGPRRVDRVIDPPQLTEFEVTLLRSSGLGELVGAVSPNLFSDQLRDRIATTYGEAAKLAAEAHDRPRFSFVHVPAPHPPAVIAADGSPINGTPSASVTRSDDPPLPREERVRRQFEEVDYISARTVELIDRIQAESERPPVIVVFSDHGTDIHWDPSEPTTPALEERTSILLAISAPGHPGLMPPDSTLINLLPILLSTYVGSDLQPRDDSIWSWRSGVDILDLLEVDPTDWDVKGSGS